MEFIDLELEGEDSEKVKSRVNLKSLLESKAKMVYRLLEEIERMDKFYLEELELNNYKKYETEKFKLNEKFTLFIGSNATGKTTILDGIATLLGGFLSGFSNLSSKETHSIKTRDMKVEYQEVNGNRVVKPHDNTYVSGIFSVKEERVEWKRNKKTIKSNSNVSKKEYKRMYEIIKELEENDESILPIFSYHGTGRVWEQEKKNVSKMENLKRVDAYKGCLDAKSNYRNFLSWFEKLSRSSFETGEKILLLEEVKSVIINALSCLDRNEIKLIRYREGDLEVLYKSGEIQRVGMLSDGYRNIIGVVSDIAYRMSILNPRLENCIENTPGIVLIDEIDLHLHPMWQRKFIKTLEELFPRVQFIASSHSPFIAQATEQHQIIRLEKDAVEELEGDAGLLSIEDIAEKYMGVDLPQVGERKQEMFEAAKKYYDILDRMVEVKLNEEELKDLKDELDRLRKPFESNPAYSALLERERMLAELKLVK